MAARAADPTVCLLGDRDARSAFAGKLRRWGEGLAPLVELYEPDAPGPVDVAIHIDWTNRFGEGPMPAARRRVAVRPWDFGPYPQRWIDVVESTFDELWVHSQWNRDCAIAGGVDEARVRVVPLGMDPRIMRPGGPTADIGKPSSFVFLFLGAAIIRKGIDILLTAFTEAFGPEDDVVLTVKDHTGDVFYDGLTFRDRILAAAADPANAQIVYIDDYLIEEDLAALYRRADAFVLPYRAEGFAIPVLEAMACGVVPIVPRFGACLDYCDEGNSVLIDPKRIRMPIGREFATNTLGFTEQVDAVDFCEVPVARLAETLREVAELGRTGLRGIGDKASLTAQPWTWEASVRAVEAGVRELAAG